MGTGHLILVGLMGAGKTTVGKRCAELLGRDFVDTDELIEATARMSVADIFATAGEEHFRELERTAVADACASPASLVIACGGGAVLDGDNRRRLRASGFVVWLRAAAAVLDERVGDSADRPLLRGGASPSTTLSRLVIQRAPAYEAVAHAAVDTDARTVDEVAAAVIGELEAWSA